MTTTGFSEFDGTSEKWSSWVCRLENFLVLQKKDAAADKKHAILAFMGADAFRKLFEKLSPEKKPADISYDEIVKIVEEIVEPQKNRWTSRIAFRKMCQRAGETLVQFESRLRSASQHCAWAANEIQTNLIEQFVAGVNDKAIQQALILKCADAKELAAVFKMADEIASVQQAASAIREKQLMPPADLNLLRPAKGSKKAHDAARKLPRAPADTRKCYRCGDPRHLANVCRFKGVKCNQCGVTGHLSKVCGQKARERQHYINEETFNYVNRASDPQRGHIEVDVHLEGHPVRMELDTGSGVSTMALSRFLKMVAQPELHENDIRLRTATGQCVQPHSYALVDVTYGGQTQKLQLYLVDQDDFPTLFGRGWMRSVRLDWTALVPCHAMRTQVKDYKEEAARLLEKHANLHRDGIGKITSTEVGFQFHTPPQPAYHRPRPVAEALLSLVEKELELLEANGVVERVNVSDWAHPIVVVPRANGKKVRICGDFKVGLNKFLKVDDYPLKNIRHALDNIGVGSRFTKLDISSAFLHMPVREEDQKFLVINTHRGLFKFTRMSNGLSNASAVWQRFIESLLAGIEGVEVVIDDIIITAPNDEQHLERLDEVLRRLNEQDIRLNRDKCVFFEEQVSFCGFVLKRQEIHKSDDKISAIMDAPTPTSTTELKSFLGLVQFYAPFAPQLADLAHPLYNALKGKPGRFHWTEDMEQAFAAVKDELCSPRILVPFDPSKALILATDASATGISAVLSHREADESERPIAYYSRTLSAAEKKYTAMEREALAIKVGMEKFFYYLFGRRFTLITDSKPLVSIFSPSKSLPPLSATRMQNYCMFLLAFNYDIKYRNTGAHGNADALSRLPKRSEDLPLLQAEEDVLMMKIVDELPLNMKTLAKETAKSDLLSPLLRTLRGDATSSAKKSRIDACEFTLVDGVIFRGHRVVIPESCREAILGELHEGHFGPQKIKELARRYVWWDTLDKDIEHLSNSCHICLQHAKTPPKSTHPWTKTSRSFERIHLDYAGPIDGKYLLLIVCAHTKWLEVYICNNKTTKTTLQHLREAVARFGLPSVVVTDNDPTFKSYEFETFCSSNGVLHKTSPPYHPASNGQVERYVQTTKNALKKLKAES